jgi:hypothetical protein
MTIVQGTCAPRFAKLREAFERNFVEDGEVGAAVSVTLDGRDRRRSLGRSSRRARARGRGSATRSSA